MLAASPLVILVSLVHLALCGVAVWKWKNPIYRLPPFLVATAEPFMYEWDNIVVGIITMNLTTAAFLAALRIEEMWKTKKPEKEK